MPTTRPPRALLIALTANAVLLALILAAIAGRPWAAAARADVATSSPAHGLSVMPAQMSVNTYGCFLMDTDGQTLLAYQYLPAERELKLVAARDVQYDRRLTNFNTSPPPLDVKQLDDAAKQPSRAAPPEPPRSPER